MKEGDKKRKAGEGCRSGRWQERAKRGLSVNLKGGNKKEKAGKGCRCGGGQERAER